MCFCAFVCVGFWASYAHSTHSFKFMQTSEKYVYTSHNVNDPTNSIHNFGGQPPWIWADTEAATHLHQ